MRLAIAAIALVFLVSAPFARSEDPYPRAAFVAQDRTPVRSGPGDDHYSTDELSRGAEIEIHQRTKSGWLAIRPLESSFSWVAQRDVEIGDDRTVAKVVGSTAVSWMARTSRNRLTTNGWSS